MKKDECFGKPVQLPARRRGAGADLGRDPRLAVLAAVLAGMLAGLATGVLHTACGIPAILAGILTQLALYSINLRIMAIGDENATTKATLAVSGAKSGCCCWCC